MQFIVSIFFIGLIAGASASSGWGYGGGHNGPSSWHDIFKLCGGKKQSPIDIELHKRIHLPNMTPLLFGGSANVDCTLTNNGHAIQCTMDSTAASPYTVTGGPFSYNYQLGQFHVHFGDSPTRGSEHTLHGRQYAAEVHFVFFNKDMYLSIADAADNANGLAVIGAFVDIRSTPHTEFDKITSNAYKVKYNGDVTPLAVSIDKLMPATHFYSTYAGSLTTPSCDESVTWVVLDSHIHVSTSQLDKLRTQLYIGDSIDPIQLMVNNYRPTQPINNRRVFHN